MKKQINKFILLIIMILSFTFNVNAASLSFDGDNAIEAEKTKEQNIVLKSNNKEVTEIHFKFEVTQSTEDATLDIFKDDSVSGEVNKNGMSILNADPFVDGTIALINITNNNKSPTTKDITIKLTDVILKYEDGTEKNHSDITKQITLRGKTITTTRPLSNDAKISNLTFSQGTLTPSFKSDVKEYKVYDLKDTIQNITISLKCDHCNYNIQCEDGCTNDTNKTRPKLEIGKNTIKIYTTSESNLYNEEYTFIVYRGETNDNSTYLSDIKIDGFELNKKFDKEVLDYTLTIPFEVTALNIDAIAEDSTAKIQLNGNEDLLVGENVITITVTSSETNDTSIYNITITRLEEDEEKPEEEPTTQIIENEDKNNNKTLIIILIVAGSLLLIALMGYLLFFRKKKQKVKSKENLKDTDEKKEAGNINQKENPEETKIIEEKKSNVDDALQDLMTTKEILFKEE